LTKFRKNNRIKLNLGGTMPKYLGVCEGCGFTHTDEAADEAEATTKMETIHRERRPECQQPKLKVAETTM
jgi:hypothetical protein